MRSVIVSVIMALLFCSSGFGAGEWILDGKAKCKVWNIDPRPNETVSWSGACVDGYASGTGTNTWYQDGKEVERYEGVMFKGRPHGKGSVTWANGARYEGDFVYGKPHGRGTYAWANGGRYDGGFTDGERAGKGTFRFANGDVYEGDFVNDRRTGSGTYTWINGSRYTGDFVNGRRTGDGTFTCRNGRQFSGTFKNGKPVGFTVDCDPVGEQSL